MINNLQVYASQIFTFPMNTLIIMFADFQMKTRSSTAQLTHQYYMVTRLHGHMTYIGEADKQIIRCDTVRCC